MGGNSSYNKEWGGVPKAKRTHEDTGYRIDGHKVVIFKEGSERKKNILNSNTANATYLIAKKYPDGTIEVHGVNMFKGHDLSYEINLEFDENGNLKPFNNGSGSHAHIWTKDPSDGKLKRKSHDKKNCFPIDSMYNGLIKKIVEFSKKKKIYNGKNQ